MSIGTEQNESALYHIGCRPGEVGRYVLLPGDPGRVSMIAELLDEPKKIAHNREYLTYTGKIFGEKSICHFNRNGMPFNRNCDRRIKNGRS